jgi:hypothetical protein
MKNKKLFFVAGYFALGLFGGWLIGSIAPVKGIKPTNIKHIKAEYYLELKPDNTAIIEDRYGYIYTCPIDSIAPVLIRDNL